MTAGNGLPCVRCGTSEWDKRGNCVECQRGHWRRWKNSNQEKEAERKRRWYRANVEYYRQWRKTNPEKVSAKNRRWNQANQEKTAALTRRHRTRKTQAGGSHTAEEFKALCTHYGNTCLCCGRDNVKLTFDHVMPVSKGGTSDISNGQPLCGSCNSSKGDRYIDYRPDAGPLRWTQPALMSLQNA